MGFSRERRWNTTLKVKSRLLHVVSTITKKHGIF